MTVHGAKPQAVATAGPSVTPAEYHNPTHRQEPPPRPLHAPTFSAPRSIYSPLLPGICRDGAVSGFVNGFKVVCFSDTYGKDKTGGDFFVSNTITYYDCVRVFLHRYPFSA